MIIDTNNENFPETPRILAMQVAQFVGTRHVNQPLVAAETAIASFASVSLILQCASSFFS